MLLLLPIHIYLYIQTQFQGAKCLRVEMVVPVNHTDIVPTSVNVTMTLAGTILWYRKRRRVEQGKHRLATRLLTTDKEGV